MRGWEGSIPGYIQTQNSSGALQRKAGEKTPGPILSGGIHPMTDPCDDCDQDPDDCGCDPIDCKLEYLENIYEGMRES